MHIRQWNLKAIGIALGFFGLFLAVVFPAAAAPVPGGPGLVSIDYSFGTSLPLIIK